MKTCCERFAAHHERPDRLAESLDIDGIGRETCVRVTRDGGRDRFGQLFGGAPFELAGKHVEIDPESYDDLLILTVGERR